MPWKIVALVWTHFISDFILQTDKMATSKSSSNIWLGIHVLVYAAPFWLFFGFWYAVINAILHFVVDWFTSRGTSYLWKKGERHWFFVLIGLDQAIHISTLILTLQLLS